MPLPFSKTSNAVLVLERLRRRDMARGLVRLEYECHDTGLPQQRWLEVTIHCDAQMPRRQLKRLIQQGAWHALEEYYDGADPLDGNLFVPSEISDEDEGGLRKALSDISLDSLGELPGGRAVRWLRRRDIPADILRKLESAA